MAARSQAWTYRSITGIARASATVAERAFHRSSQVGVRQHVLGPKDRVSPELDGVTFDQITGPSWVRPAGFDALHHADRGPDRACEVTQQVAGGPASARRGALPVGLDDLDQDGVKKSSPWLNSSAVRLLIPGLPSTPADELEWSDSLRLPRCRRVD